MSYSLNGNLEGDLVAMASQTPSIQKCAPGFNIWALVLLVHLPPELYPPLRNDDSGGEVHDLQHLTRLPVGVPPQGLAVQVF